jgi:hypothetical protein
VLQSGNSLSYIIDYVNHNHVSVFTLIFPQTATGSNIDTTLTSAFHVSSGGSYKKNHI